MTKQDFVLIARVIRAQPTRLQLSRAFAAELRKTNPHFDEFRFLSACDAPLYELEILATSRSPT